MPSDLSLAHILSIGFSSAEAVELEDFAPAPALQSAADLSAALHMLASNSQWFPAIVLLAEPRPGIWTTLNLQPLRRLAPLARILRITGAWCEGQQRSGHPPAGSFGLGWHQAGRWLRRELAEPAGGALAAPLSATREDLLLWDTPRSPNHDGGKAIAIHAPRAAQAAAWAAVCRGLGHRADIAPNCAELRANPADAVLWDCDPCELSDGSRVRTFVAGAGLAPVIAICGFPRPRDVEIARQNGVAAVLAKPLLLADLEWLFSRLFDARGAG